MSTRTNQLAQALGLKEYEDLAYGRLNGIFLNTSINNYNGMASVNVFARRDNAFDITEAESFLAQNIDKYKSAQASYDGQALSITVPRLGIETVSELITGLTLFLYNRSYRSACSMCDNTDALGYIVKDGAVIEVCPECRNKLECTAEDTAQQRPGTGSYLKGATGAALGGIVGIILWIIVDALGLIAGFCGLIIAYLSYKGYRLMKGRRGKGMVFIIAAVLIVFTFLAVIVSQTLTVYNSYSGDKSSLSIFSLFGAELAMPFTNNTINFGENFLSPDPGSVWTEIGLGWFFAAAGSALFLTKIFKPGANKDITVKRLEPDENLTVSDTTPKE